MRNQKSSLKKFVFCSLILTGILSVSHTYAQANRFGLGIAAGFNLSQIDGDKHQGYDKKGLSFGLTGIVKFKKQFNLGLELAYNQLGSQSGDIANNQISSGVHPFDLTLNYAGIAVLPNFFFYETYDDYHRFRLSTGLSFSRLINASVEERLFSGQMQESAIIYKEIIDDFSRDDLSLLVGLTLFITERIGIELRQGVGLRPIYKFEERNRRFLNYYLTFRGSYTF